MSFIAKVFYKMRGKPVPYYAEYPLWLIVWKPIRKFINTVVIANVPFAQLRVVFYRTIGFKIGKNVFIGMKCYLDDVDPSKTIIGDNVVISYGCYFASHGKNQGHTYITLKNGAYLGMRVNVVSGKHGITIGANSVIGAGALVITSVPDDATYIGVPARATSMSPEK